MNTVIPEVVKTDYWKKIGLNMKEIKAVLKHLEIEFKDIGIVLNQKNDTHHTDILHNRKMEKEFIDKNAKEGKDYIVSSREHVWLIADKTTVDPTWIVPSKQGTRRRLNSAIEIVRAA
jgi:DNA-binding transcriptional MerR regulator